MTGGGGEGPGRVVVVGSNQGGERGQSLGIGVGAVGSDWRWMRGKEAVEGVQGANPPG